MHTGLYITTGWSAGNFNLSAYYEKFVEDQSINIFCFLCCTKIGRHEK